MKKLLLGLFLLISACTQRSHLGSEQNPLTLAVVPGKDVQALATDGEVLREFLQKETGLHIKLLVPFNFVAVVEALGSQRADMAIMNSFGYLLANQKYQAQARLITLSHGKDHYYGTIMVRADSKIEKLEDLQGKTFAFVDPASTSGYLLPQDLFLQFNIKPSEIIFAGRHDAVVSMIYQKRVDAGAAFYSPPENGEEMDARRLVKTQFPDVFKKIKIIKLTGPIPNDPVVFRKDLAPGLEEKLIAAFIKASVTPSTQSALKSLYNITGVMAVQDSYYDGLRKIAQRSGKDLEGLIKK